MISPSDEDSFTFTVSAANGDIFKLRGKYVGGTLNWTIWAIFFITGTFILLILLYFLLSVSHPILAPLLSKDVTLSTPVCIRSVPAHTAGRLSQFL